MASVERRSDGTWRIVDDEQSVGHTAHAVTDASGAVWVYVDGHVVVLGGPAPARTRGRAPGAADLEAPMPAQVSAVLVAAGDEVTAGAPLVLLDAMKMELPLRAPFEARVDAVHCAAGDRVAPGRVLVDLTRREGTS